MAKKNKAKSQSGPRAPPGKKPLLVIIDEKLIEDAKVAAIRDKTKVSQVVEDLLRGWLAGRAASSRAPFWKISVEFLYMGDALAPHAA